MKFSELKIKPDIRKGLAQAGFEEMFPVQEKSIQPCLDGKDLIGKAESGSGKTIAFLVPLLEKISTRDRALQAIIIAPTRELALQISNEAERIAGPLGAKILTVYGGRSIEPQIHALRFSGIHIVVGTPGRLIDHLQRRSLDLSKIKIVVLDEADRMLDMGFIEDIDYILRQTPGQRQTFLFSATLPEQIRSLVHRYMRSPVVVELNAEQPSVEKIAHVVCIAMNRDKPGCLEKLLETEKPELAIIFVSTKRMAHSLDRKLSRIYPSASVHGDKTQGQRERALGLLRSRKIRILVATDVAARGLDIENLSHVINYDVPNDVETFIHRVGRTGRAGAPGKAFHIILPEDVSEISAMMQASKATLAEKRFFGGATAEEIARIEQEFSQQHAMRPKYSRGRGGGGYARRGARQQYGRNFNRERNFRRGGNFRRRGNFRRGGR